MENNIKLLMTVTNDLEANIIESLLRQYNIPVYKRHKLAGAYISIITGSSNFGIDIFVSDEDFDDALEIVNAPNELDDEE